MEYGQTLIDKAAKRWRGGDVAFFRQSRALAALDKLRRTD